MSKNTKPHNPAAARILRYLRPHRREVVLSFVFSAGNVSLSLWIPILIGRVIDLIGERSSAAGNYLSLLPVIAAAAAGAALCLYFASICSNRISYGVSRRLRGDCFEAINSVPLRYIDANPHGDVITRVVTDIDVISDGLLQGTAQLFSGAATIIGTIIFMLSLNVPIAILVVVLTPLSVFTASFIAKRIHRSFIENSVIQGEVGGYCAEIIKNQKLVSAFSYREHAREKFSEINRRLYICGQRAQFYSSLINPATRFINNLVYAAAGVAGALLAVRGQLSIGQLSGFLTYANQYTKPFNEISGVVSQLQAASASARRVFALLDEEREEDSGIIDDGVIDESMINHGMINHGTINHGTINHGSINHGTADRAVIEPAGNRYGLLFEDVDFSYIPEKPLIKNLNLDIKYGTHVAVAGPTGSGKTTLVNLLMRFYDVCGGSIKMDGVDVREFSRTALRSRFGMVSQESWLFEGTVHDNISYGRPESTRAEVIAVAKAAYIHGFIEGLPEGYDTVVGSGGTGISQGQCQLLCIARVMLTMPPVLILDEATSSIDVMTERRIRDAFETMTAGRTSFTVAHRLSTIRAADLILVMDNGNIVESGTHDELLEINGFYSVMWNSQFKE